MLNKLKNLFSYFKKNEILAIELGRDVIRGVVVKKEGEKVAILTKAEVVTSHKFTNYHEDIDRVLEKLGRYPKRVVLVSPEVKFLTGELPIPANTKLSSGKLSEAVKWEAQAYLDFSISEGLFGYQLQDNKYSSGKAVPVLITAISKGTYGRLADICKRCHLNLEAVYAKENAFAYSLNRFSGAKKSVILNLEQNLIGGALINSGHPIVFQTAPLDAVERLVSDLISVAGGVDKVIIAGSQGGYVEKVIDKLRGLMLSVRLWRPQDDILGFQTKNLSGISSQFASCAGAALQELKVTSKGELGIDDRVALNVRFKLSAHILPLVIVGVVLTGFLVHYLFIKSSFWRYSSVVKKLEIEKRTYENNLSELKNIKSQISSSYKKKNYIETVLPARNKRLLNLFDGIAGEIPYDVILDRIIQDESDVFLLEGSGLSAGSITTFVGQLEHLKVTQEAKLQSISEKKTGAEDTDMFLYQFRIKVVLK